MIYLEEIGFIRKGMRFEFRVEVICSKMTLR
jgi:hypothetical protein